MTFTVSNYEDKCNVFSVIVFESDLDINLKTAYFCYDERWLLVHVFPHYKSDQINVED